MIRIDKFLADLNIGTRSQVKTYIKNGLIMVNNHIIKDSGHKIDENNDIVIYQGTVLGYEKYHYYMLHKPKGYVTATRDLHEKTVMDLLKDVPQRDLSPVGRLDKDTEGLLLITNDGALTHSLLSPKKHVDKKYRVVCMAPLSEEDIKELETGVDIGDKKRTLPAKIEKISPTEIILTIQEGRFHQVKRMLQAVHNEVIYLKRESFGSLCLDKTLNLGEFRKLTTEEIDALRKDS